MSTFAIVQALIIVAVVLISAVQALIKLAPKSARRLQSRLSAALDRPGRGVAMRRNGRVLQPAEARVGGCRTGDGCGGCPSVAPVAKPQNVEHAPPLHFRSRDR